MRAKKSLGQHFLTSARIAQTIAAAAPLGAADTVLEIGPGKGVLTRKLAARAGRVLAIEKDQRLITQLRKTLPHTVTVVAGDALTVDLESIGLQSGAYSVVANIPYYITGALIERLLSGHVVPNCMVLLVQKEVAERIVARDGKESILSISVKAYGKPKIISTVGRGNFKPVPQVDSAILVIENISKKFFSEISEHDFFALVKAGFAHKRKRLVRNLEPRFKGHDAVLAAFRAAGLSENARAEDVSLEQWRILAEHASVYGNTA